MSLLRKLNTKTLTDLLDASRIFKVSISKKGFNTILSINTVLESRITPLHVSATYNLELFHEIYVKSEEKTPLTHDSETPLHFAAKKGQLDVCQFIIENSKDKNPKNTRGITPLHCAAWFGSTDVFKIIIKGIHLLFSLKL